MHAEIERCIREQEALGLDVLVHGEAERNDMVEYFGEQLEGFASSQHGRVQSYGSRCVKACHDAVQDGRNTWIGRWSLSASQPTVCETRPTIETSRSDMELLQAFDTFEYPIDIGPGAYDIHSPNIPTREEIIDLMQKAGERIPVRHLSVKPALRNLVDAAKELREIYHHS